jgi:uncharacterized protein
MQIDVEVGALLQSKGTQVYSVTPETKVFDAIQMMAEKNVGALVVLSDDRVVGIFSERDYTRKVVLHGKSSKETEVRGTVIHAGDQREPRIECRGVHAPDDHLPGAAPADPRRRKAGGCDLDWRPRELDDLRAEHGDSSATELHRGPVPRMSTPQRRAWVALLLLLPVPSLGTAASMWWWPGTPWGQGVFMAAKIWIVALPVFWLLRIEKAPLSWSPPRAGGFGIAVALGIAAALAIFAMYGVAIRREWIIPADVAARAAQTGLDRSRGLLCRRALLDHAQLADGGVCVAVVLFSAMRSAPGWRGRCAGLRPGIHPASHHRVGRQFPPVATVLGSVGVFCGGAMWSWLYLRYRSVWPCYVSHAIVDVPIFILGYHLIFRATGPG